MGSESPDLQSLDRKAQIVYGRGWAGKMQHIMELAWYFEMSGDVMLDKLEAGMVLQMGYVIR